MRILFICGSLDPGKGGLGDYVLQLATAMQSRGWQCACIALNDTTTNFDADKAITMENSDDVQIFRIEKNVNNAQKAILFKYVIATFNPDIVSLQLVTYAYHPRGWMGVFNKYFAPLLAERQVHLMWQELWIGERRNSPISHRIEGIWQKYEVKNMLKIVKPNLQQTSIPFYKMLLKDEGIDASILPMFSNFALEKSKDFDLRSTININENEQNALIMICFGAIFKEFPFSWWLKEAELWHQQTGRNVVLCSIGRMGGSGIYWGKWEKLAKQVKGVRLCSVGPLSPSDLQAAFSQAEVGVNLTPLEVWGKSTSIAAMLENGLPVISYEFGIAPLSLNFKNTLTDGIIALKMDKLNMWPVQFNRREPYRKLELVCEQFILDLQVLK